MIGLEFNLKYSVLHSLCLHLEMRTVFSAKQDLLTCLENHLSMKTPQLVVFQTSAYLSVKSNGYSCCVKIDQSIRRMLHDQKLSFLNF